MLSWAKQACPIPGTAHCPNNTTYNKGRGKAGVANVDPEGWQVIVTHLCGAVCGWRGLGEAGEENPGLITLATLCWGRRGSAGRSRSRTSTRIRTNNQGKYRQSRIIRANNTYISHASARWKMEKNLGE